MTPPPRMTPALGLWVKSLGFAYWGLGFGFACGDFSELDSCVGVQGSGFGMERLALRVCGVEGSGLRSQGSGPVFFIQDSGSEI